MFHITKKPIDFPYEYYSINTSKNESKRIEYNNGIKKIILANDHQSLIDYKLQGRAFNLVIPTPEHYLPMLYVLALKEENEKVRLFNDKTVAGSLAMTSFIIEKE